MGNSIGKEFVITSFGESHGKLIGVVVDGCPAGLALSEVDFKKELDARIPLKNPTIVSGRIEKDNVTISSGVFNGYTTGAPICLTVENKQCFPLDYEHIRYLPRPSHADYPANKKYANFYDYRGGGRFSGRVTVAIIMAGVIAKKILSPFGIEILAYTTAIGKVKMTKSLSFDYIREHKFETSVRCPDAESAKNMEDSIVKAKQDGDSLGGIVECISSNLPVGLGEPLFDALDADLAKALFMIPAIKGVEFGVGFKAAELKGSENNDPFIIREGEVVTKTNFSGGILGGISSGMPIILRVAVKPTPSIAKEQQTVNLQKMQDAILSIKGRHDPCIVPKAVPVVEAAVAITLVDHMIRAGFIPKILKV